MSSGTGTYRSDPKRYEADTTVWCEDGHTPKIVKEDRGVGICPECGNEFDIETEVSIRE